MARTLFIAALITLCGVVLADEQPVAADNEPRHWTATSTIEAPEAHQAAAADEMLVYAIASTVVARYDRNTGERLAVSSGEAQHLNSGYLWKGQLLCAHSNYPKKPEQSQIKVLNLNSMQLSTHHDFKNYGGSLTWVVRHDDHWWCNFARYGDENHETFLARFDDNWKETGRWTYPAAVIAKLGRHSLSGGLWQNGSLLVTGHDDPLVFRLRLPTEGAVLELIDTQAVPFTGQGFARDPRSGGLIGINRARRQIVFATQE